MNIKEIPGFKGKDITGGRGSYIGKKVKLSMYLTK
jgi:hypothetical protein